MARGGWSGRVPAVPRTWPTAGGAGPEWTRTGSAHQRGARRPFLQCGRGGPVGGIGRRGRSRVGFHPEFKGVVWTNGGPCALSQGRRRLLSGDYGDDEP